MGRRAVKERKEWRWICRNEGIWQGRAYELVQHQKNSEQIIEREERLLICFRYGRQSTGKPEGYVYGSPMQPTNANLPVSRLQPIFRTPISIHSHETPSKNLLIAPLQLEPSLRDPILHQRPNSLLRTARLLNNRPISLPHKARLHTLLHPAQQPIPIPFHI